MIETNNAEEYLTKHNWIKIYKPLNYGTYDIFTYGKINDEQMKTLIKLDLDNVHSISNFL